MTLEAARKTKLEQLSALIWEPHIHGKLKHYLFAEFDWTKFFYEMQAVTPALIYLFCIDKAIVLSTIIAVHCLPNPLLFLSASVAILAFSLSL
jgi:hypothetical protein